MPAARERRRHLATFRAHSKWQQLNVPVPIGACRLCVFCDLFLRLRRSVLASRQGCPSGSCQQGDWEGRIAKRQQFTQERNIHEHHSLCDLTAKGGRTPTLRWGRHICRNRCVRAVAQNIIRSLRVVPIGNIGLTPCLGSVPLFKPRAQIRKRRPFDASDVAVAVPYSGVVAGLAAPVRN